MNVVDKNLRLVKEQGKRKESTLELESSFNGQPCNIYGKFVSNGWTQEFLESKYPGEWFLFWKVKIT